MFRRQALSLFSGKEEGTLLALAQHVEPTLTDSHKLAYRLEPAETDFFPHFT
jgi:hypothetical protein